MALADSLLSAIVRADGDALVMHVGERPYVVVGTNPLHISTHELTLDTTISMMSQLLPAESLATLEEFGAVEYRLPDLADDRFNVVAARGGDDIWIEIRRRRNQSEAAVAAAAERRQAEEAALAAQRAAEEAEQQRLAAEAAAAEERLRAEEEQRRIAEEEQRRIEEEQRRLAEEEARRAAEAAAIEEERRVAEAALEEARQAAEAAALEEQRLAAEAAAREEQRRVEEEQRRIEEEQRRLAEEEARRAAEAAAIEEERRAAEAAALEEQRLAAEAAAREEQRRIEEEQRRLAEEEEQRRLAEEVARREAEAEAFEEARRAAEAAAIEEARRAAEAAALEEQRRIEEEQRRIEEEQRRIEEEQRRVAEEEARRAAEAAAIAEERRIAEAAIEEARRAAEAAAIEEARRAAEAAAIEEERRAAEAAALEEQRRAAEAAALEEQRRIEQEQRLAEEAQRRAAEAAAREERRLAAEAAAIAEERRIAEAAIEEARRAAAAEQAQPPMQMAASTPHEPMAKGDELQTVVPMTRTVRIEVPHRGPAARSTDIERLLRIAAARGASALFVTSEARPYIRVDGDIRQLEGEAVLSRSDVEAAIVEIAPESGREPINKGEATEWLREYPELGRIRCTTFNDHRGPGVILRMIATRAATAESLGLSREVQALATESQGLVLVSGPRASGKSTLLSALVDLVNRQRAEFVITLERQIRLVHDNKAALVSQREIRGGAEEALAAARSALREGPDVLVIDDLISPQMVPLILTAASEGLLVFVSIAAPSTSDAVERFIELAAPEMRAAVQAAMAEAFRGAVAQTLLKKTGGGLISAREVLLGTAPVARVISEGQLGQLPHALEGGRKHGMQSFAETLVEYVRGGSLDVREAFRKAPDRDRLLAALKREKIDTSLVERLA